MTKVKVYRTSGAGVDKWEVRLPHANWSQNAFQVTK